jgi:putative transposase
MIRACHQEGNSRSPTARRTETLIEGLDRPRSFRDDKQESIRGSPMTSKPVAFLLADLGVTKSHSRPHCSNDNPDSESQFRTMKYRPEFPDRFGSYQDAHAFCGRFFGWYNHEHRHSGIGFHTPGDVHHGRAELVRARRADVLSAAYAQHPERFVRKPPTPPALPTAAWINEPKEDTATTQ